MRKLSVIAILLCVLCIAGCSYTYSTQPKPSQPVQNAIEETPAFSQALETPGSPTIQNVRFCDEPEEYVELEKFLRGFGFGDDERLELYPWRLKNALWRNSFYDGAPEKAYVLLCATSEAECASGANVGIPGDEEHRIGGNGINIRVINNNPAYSDAAKEEVRYLVDKESTFKVFYDDVVILLNGYGITERSYPILAPQTAYSMLKYINHDINRVIEGVKGPGEPNSIYEIYYCGNEIIWFEQLEDIGVKGVDWDDKAES